MHMKSINSLPSENINKLSYKNRKISARGGGRGVIVPTQLVWLSCVRFISWRSFVRLFEEWIQVWLLYPGFLTLQKYGTKPPSSTIFLNFPRCCSAASLSRLAASACPTILCNPALFLIPVNHPLVLKILLHRTSTCTRSLSTKFLKQLFDFSQIIASLTLSPAMRFPLIHTNKRVSIRSVILQRELFSLEVPSATCTLLNSFFFF